MNKGISVYAGLDYPLEDNLNYIAQAASAGFKRIFTSLHIPETNFQIAVREFRQLLECANLYNMSVVADISPNAFQYLGISADNLKALAQLGIRQIRLDYGFKPEIIAKYTNNQYGIKIELNASTLSHSFLNEIIANGANIKNLSASHNFYPRQNTGLSITSMLNKNNILKSFGIESAAFVSLPSGSRRGPLFEGLPSLECGRHISPHVMIQLLYLIGTDQVYIGDAIASLGVLNSLGKLDKNVVELAIDSSYFNIKPYDSLLLQVHTNRPDSAEDVIRSQESRLVLAENTYVNNHIEPQNTVRRNRGSVTLDNIGYLRYMGELQVCRKELPADSRINVIGQIRADWLILLDYIGDSQKFKFVADI